MRSPSTPCAAQTTRNGQPCLKLLGGAVTARLAAEHRLTVEWSSSAMNDMVADSVLAFAAQAECSPLSLRGARRGLPPPRAQHLHPAPAEAHGRWLPCRRSYINEARARRGEGGGGRGGRAQDRVVWFLMGRAARAQHGPVPVAAGKTSSLTPRPPPQPPRLVTRTHRLRSRRTRVQGGVREERGGGH